MGNTDTRTIGAMLTVSDCAHIEAEADKSSATTRKTLQFRTQTFKVGDYKVSITVERNARSTEEEQFITAERTRIDGNAKRKAAEDADRRRAEKLEAGDLALAGAVKAQTLFASLRG